MAARRHRCLVVPLTRRSADALVRSGKPGAQEAQDAHLLPTQIATPEMFTAAEAALIDKNQRLPNGVPLLPNQTWASSPWSIPGNVRHDWKLIRARYADRPEVLAAFEQWAQKNEVTKGVTVSQWIGEGVTAKVTLKKVAKTAASTNVAEALAIAGIDAAQPITEIQAQALLEELKEETPHDVSAKITAIKGLPRKKKARKVKVITPNGVSERVIPAVQPVLTEKLIREVFADFVSYLPPNVARDLPAFTVGCVRTNRYAGAYMPSWYPQARNGPVLNLATQQMRSEAHVRSTLFHELAHWLHLELPADHAWVKEVKTHFEKRTAGEAVVNLGNGLGTGKRDKWFDAYMGRIYELKSAAAATHAEAHLGMEFPTRCLELLAPGFPTMKNPTPLSVAANFAAVWNSSPEARDDILLALKGLYP